ncbi:hypothetical protein JCM3765_002135 [Sporobolomyces pararoseus]
MTLQSSSTFTTEDLRSALPTLETQPPSVPTPLLSSSPKRIRPSPPRLELPQSNRYNQRQNEAEPVPSSKEGAPERVRPALFVQPASPAMSDQTSPPPPPATLSTSPISTTFPDSPLHNNSPFPLPIPSSSSAPSPPIRSNSTPFPTTLGGGPPPPLSPGGGGGLAARRAAKLGKKRLSLVVPTANHLASTASSRTLLSPTTPSHLRTTVPADSPENEALLEAAETRSLPPSPISLVTFIGTEGSEQPDRTIGRLMLKQQADEMREQMRGGRGMKRRTSIPRLNLAAANVTPAPIGKGSASSSSTSGKAKPTLSLGSGGGGGSLTSAVQFLRRETSEDSTEDGAEVEEFPYALGPREILPGIYLGSEQNAKDPRVLKDWKFGFVLNVAKEVDCPWVDEVIEDEEVNGPKEEEKKEKSIATTTPSPPRKHKHRRTKTQAAVDVRASTPSGTPSEARPVRPPFIRPTASTPNLQSVFKSSSSFTSTAPPVPPLPKIHLPATPDASEEMLRSLSSSPPNSYPPIPRRSPPRVRIHPHSAKNPSASTTPSLPPSTCRSKGVVRFPQNRRTGRPSIEYLWLKWGHDEADLVEAHKFQSAFDFLDEARDRGEKVLVHCQCGVSRSATVVIAYCMREAAKALEEGRDAKELSGCTGMHDTYSFVKEKSEWVGPNLGLVFQLVAYERTLRGDSNDPEEEENGYPRYPPEPPSTERQDESRFPVYPQTPNSLDGSTTRSQFSTPDLHLPLSPTFSSGTQQSSVTSTPISIQLPNGLPQPRIAKSGEQDESAFGIRERHGSSETLKGEPAVFVLSPPPIPASTSERTLREDLVSPTVATYPSPAPSPLELPTKGRIARRPPPISLNGNALASHSLVPSPTTIDSRAPSSPHRPSPSASLPTLTTTGLPSHSSLTRSPSGGSNILSPDSAVTMSSDSSGNSASQPTTSTGGGVKKFGAQSKSERRASHRRVFSETIQVPNSIKSSWSSHSLHSAAGGTGE